MIYSSMFQSACFEKSRCAQFIFFRGDKSKCVLLKTCRKPMSSCKNCISGPAFPRVGTCGARTQQQRRPQQGRHRTAQNIQSELQGQRQTKPQPQSPGFCIVCILASAGARRGAQDDKDKDGREERNSNDKDEIADYNGDYTVQHSPF